MQIIIKNWNFISTLFSLHYLILNIYLKNNRSNYYNYYYYYVF